MRTRTVVLVLAGGTAVAVAVAGCGTSHSKNPSASAALGKVTSGYVAESAPSAAPGSLQDAVRVPADTTGTYGSAGGGGGVASKALLLSDTKSVIRRAELTVGVKKASDVAIAANRAEAIVGDLGGDVYGDDRQSGVDATATLTLKVPPESLIKALGQLSALGDEQSRSLSSQDVTTQVADVDARVKSAEASIVRLRALYASATKVSDVISIEEELSARESDLESLQAQQKTLATETQMATISFVLTTGKAPAPPKPHHKSTNAFVKGWHHFISGGGWLITVLVSVVPFVLIALLIGFGVLRGRRRRVGHDPVPEAA